MKNSKYYIKMILFITLIFSMGSCYLLKQGCTIVSNNAKAKKIDTLLKDEDLDPKVRDLFLLVKKVKRFAIDELGLRDDKNYTTYISIDKDYLADVVSACNKAKFEPYTWWYPFFGSFPYKGFFNRKDALRTAEHLRDKNLDVLVRKVDAFSTLGYFTDPLYSYMTEYSVYSIASLIIHEQTHATIWLNNRIQFNEELATFIGREGALYFLKKEYGEKTDEYVEAINSIEDNKCFTSYMKMLYKDLNAFYTMDIDSEIKIKMRSYIIHAFRERFRSVYYREFHNKNYKNFASFSINNAYIMLFITYTENLSLFYELNKNQGGDLKTTINLLKTHLKQIKKEKKDPKEYIKENFLQLKEKK